MIDRGRRQALMTLLALAVTGPTHASGGRVITDMAGRRVRLPIRPRRIATVGGVPAMNSFLFALGAGEAIVNGLPNFARKPQWRMQTVLAPHLAKQPATQGAHAVPQVETLLQLRPEVVFTMMPQHLPLLERAGLPAVYLSWKEAEAEPATSIRHTMHLMGECLGREEQAAAYRDWFDTVLDSVTERVDGLPDSVRPRVLFCHLRTFSQQFRIVNDWIAAAGGLSVTRDLPHDNDHLSLSLEQVLAWDPEVLLLWSPADRERLENDPRLRHLRAVREGRVHVAPSGAHPWASWTAEHPLMVRWAAQHFFPDRFSQEELRRTVRDFYTHFYQHPMDVRAVQRLLTPA